MPRTVTISLPAERTDPLVTDLSRLDGLLTLSVQRGTSVQPPGDVVTAEVTDRGLTPFMHALDRYGAGRDGNISVTMTEPIGMVSASSREQIARDPSSSSFEEMEFTIGRESNMGVNKLVVVALAGVIATVGLATNAVHLVIGAMVITPGFEPLVRISLGVVGGSRAWLRGVVDTAKGYGALLVAAALTTLLLRALDVDPLRGSDGYLRSGVLVEYWGRVSLTATVVTVAAAIAGALLVAATRSVLTAGVMIALALVPAAALVAMGLAANDLEVAGAAAVRWAHDAGIVMLGGLAVFASMRAKRERGLAL